MTIRRDADRSPWDAGRWPLILVGLAVVFNLWWLRQELEPPQYINDTAIHASLSGWVEERISAWRTPLDGWYEPVSMGAPRLHHYQALPYVLMGSLQIVFGESAFPAVTYLLIALWPLVIYGSARWFDLGSWPASIAAAVSPIVRSYPGFGYEQLAYTWFGPGLWAQLWAMWTLPIALSSAWRSITGRCSTRVAVLALAATICLHLPTGYLALILIPVIALVSIEDVGRRLTRALVIVITALVVAAWQIVPAVIDRAWTAPDVIDTVRFRWDSFGATRILGWLISGQIFDVGRLPVLTILVGAGVIGALLSRKRSGSERVLLLVGMVSLLLFFGRPTLGVLADLIPFGSALSYRRFIVGVHLSGIYLAGIGAVFAWERFQRMLAATSARRSVASRSVALLLAFGVAAGYWSTLQVRSWERGQMERQFALDATVGRQFRELVEAAEHDGAIRLYAGSNARPATAYRIGLAPGYISLLNDGADVVGYRRPTWSFLSSVEVLFDPGDPNHHQLFAVTHAILPGSSPPTDSSVPIDSTEVFTLWRVSDAIGYLDVGRSVGRIAADRTNLLARVRPFLDSELPELRIFPGIEFEDGNTAPEEQKGVSSEQDVVMDQRRDLDGYAGTARLSHAGVVVLRSSYHSRWSATVDGQRAPVRMVAPGFPAVLVGPGEHRVAFRYEPIGYYGWLLVLGAVGLIVARGQDRKARRAAGNQPPRIRRRSRGNPPAR